VVNCTSRRAGVAPVLLLAALASATAACSGAPRIEIEGQEARLSPALLGVCSVFMKIQNRGNGDDTLVAASVEVPGAITEIHEVREARMVRTARARVPARGVLELRPGGLHIMVFNLPKGVGPGSELTLRLVFGTSGERRTSVRIAG